MLNELPTFGLDEIGNLDLGQCLVKLNNKKIIRLSKVRDGTTLISYARSQDDCYELVLYARSNDSGRCESGIIYRPGPGCRSCKRFQMEMLRLFSIDGATCFDLAKKYYTDLVKEKNLRYLD